MVTAGDVNKKAVIAVISNGGCVRVSVTAD